MPRLAPDRGSATALTAESAIERADRRKLERVLHSKTVCKYIDMPLSEVVDDLMQRHAIQILVDGRALEDFGIGRDAPITFSLDGVTLHACLSHMLDELDLTYTIEHGTLLITTPEEAESRLETRVYRVSDLLQEMPPADAGRDHRLVTMLTTIMVVMGK